MFANRYTVVLDACVLAPVLKRDILLSLAEAEFFRPQWSPRVLSEVQGAIEDMLVKRGSDDPSARALASVSRMRAAFEEAQVDGYEPIEAGLQGLPDAEDAHVIAAAVRVSASTIVTDNLRDFPDSILGPLGIEARSCDEFVADTIDLDAQRAVAALGVMRRRFSRPDLDPTALLRKIEGQGMLATADALLAHFDRL